ncbi:hypothetical protein [Kitasatospora sp. NPDC048407]|uniref:hypothetical protein n=1 Tax=Kitasatospora sp. NPDC048407 TaxID=3364051 RepID=UPI003723FB3F
MTTEDTAFDPADAAEEAKYEAQLQQYAEEAARFGSATLTHGLLRPPVLAEELVAHFARFVREKVELDAQLAGLTVVGEVEVLHLPALTSFFSSGGEKVGVHAVPPLRGYALPDGVEADTVHTVATARAVLRPSAGQ